MIQSILGQAVPHEVAAQINPSFIGQVCTAVTKGLFVAQAEKKVSPGSGPEQLKATARRIAANDFDLLQTLVSAGNKTRQYTEAVLIPALIDGLVQGFNLAMLFDTTKPVEIGGLAAGATDGGLAYKSGAQPAFPVPEPAATPGSKASKNPHSDNIEKSGSDEKDGDNQPGCIRN